MSKAEFIQQMSELDPKQRAKFMEDSDVPEPVKRAARQDAKEAVGRSRAMDANVPPVVGDKGQAEIQKIESPEAQDRKRGPEGLTLIDSDEEDIPFHNVHGALAKYSLDKHHGETGAERRRRLADQSAGPSTSEVSSADEGPTATTAAPDASEDETPAERRRRLAALKGSSSPPPRAENMSSRRPITPTHAPKSHMDVGETAAERKRRLGALGQHDDDSPESDSEEEGGDPLETGRGTQHSPQAKRELGSAEEPSAQAPMPRPPGIRFAEQPRIPTKDERAAADAKEKEDAAPSSSAGRIGFGKLKWGKDAKK